MKIAIVIMVVNLGKNYKGNSIFGNYEKQQTKVMKFQMRSNKMREKHKSRIVEIELSHK